MRDLSGSIVWVGYELPAPESIQRVQPNEVHVFATLRGAIAWQREREVTPTSPTRVVLQCAVEADPEPVVRECGFCQGQPVQDAAEWLDGKPRPAAPCPRCGVTTPYRIARGASCG